MKSINYFNLKRLLFGLIFMFISASLFAANVQIGSGTTTTSTLPISSCYGYSYSQQIVLASEYNATGSAGDITAVRFYYDSGGTSFSDWKDWEVYIGHTTKTEFNSNTDWEPITNLTQVFNDTIAPVAGTWIEFTFSTPYTYDGTSNIVVAVRETTPNYSCTANWYSYEPTTPGNRAIYYRNDSNLPDPAAPPSASSTTNTLAQIQFEGVATSCPSVSSVNLFNVMSNTAELAWTAGGTETSWIVEYGTSGFTPGSGTSVVVSNDTTTLTGLTASTDYDVYVSALCGAGDTSVWSTISSFSTLCNAVTAPYSEDFENAGNTPTCWTQLTSNDEDWKFNNSGTGHLGNNGTMGGSTSSGGYFAWVDDSSPHSLSTTLQSPLIDVSGLTTPHLAFYRISDNEGSINVDFHVDVWDGATWNANVYFTDSNSVNGEWELVNVDLSSLTITGPIMLRFVVDETNGSDYDDDVAIDDVIVMEAPSCLTPTVLTTYNVTTDSVDVTWTAGGTETSWIVEYDTTGFTPGTGTVTVVTNDTTTLTGLTANSDYDVYVSALCGAGDTSLAVSTSFYTGYCSPAPSSVDNNGITNVTFGQNTIVNNTTGTEPNNYGDYSSLIGDGGQGTTLNVDITFETGYTYETKIWVDWNNDLDFDDANEEVYVGTSLNTNPTTLNTSFTIPLATPLGNYRMRIGSQDSGTPIPCYTGSWGSYEDYTLQVVAAPACLPPTALTTYNVTSTSADVTWTAGGTETSWIVEYDTTGFTPGTGTVTVVTNDTTTLTGLTANSDYDVYVSALCGAGDTSLAVSTSFYTGYCSPAPSSVDNNGITNVTFGQNTIVNNTTGTEPNNYGDYSSLIGDGGQGTTLNVDITFETGYTYETKIWVDWNNDLDFDDVNEEVYVGTSTSANPTTLNTSFTIPLATPLGNYRMRIGSQDSGTPIPCYTGFYGSYEDYTLQVVAAPACLTPTALTTYNVTTNSIDVTWTAGGAETSWLVEYGPTGFTLGSGTSVTATNDTISLTGLSASSTYDVYVSALCSATDTSAFTSANTFSTNCGVITAFPACQTFTGAASIPNCWSTFGSENWQIAGTWPGYGASGNTGVGVDGSGSNGTDATLQSPQYDLSAYTGAYPPQIAFQIFSDNTTNPGDNALFTLEISTDNGTTWSSIFTYQSDGGWNDVAVDLSPYTNDTVQFRFIVDFTVMTSTQFYNDILIENVCVQESPSCIAPTSLASAGVTSNTADIYWTHAPAVDYLVEYGPQGFVQGTGTSVIVMGSDTANLSSLSPSSTFDVYVQAICGIGDSSVIAGPYTFTTLCGPITSFPACQDFNGLGAIPNCWSTYGSENWQIAGTWPNYGASGMTGVGVDGSGSNGTDATLQTPLYDLTSYSGTNLPQLSFDMFSDNTNNPGDNALLTVEISNDFGTTWTPILSLQNNNGWTNQFFILNDYLTDTVTFRFIVDHTVMTTTQFYNDILMNNVCIEEAPNCIQPTNFVLSNVEGTSITVNWSDFSNAGNFLVEYGPTGFAPGTGTTTTTTDTFINITGTTALTLYDIYVQAICSATDSSSVSNYTFATGTDCDAAIITAQTINDCANNEYSIDLDVTDIGDAATLYVTDGTDTLTTITATGITTVGPFNNGTVTNINILHDVDTLCDLSASLVNLPCNDDVCDAQEIIVNAPPVGGSNIAATAQTNEPFASCFSTFNADTATVWYSFVAPNNGEALITTDFTGGTLTNTDIALYSYAGTDCSIFSNYTEVDCDAFSGVVVGSNGVIDATGLTPGETYYVQVEGFSNNTGTFSIQVTTDCEIPTNAMISNETETSVELSWVENGAATSWIVEYGAPGFAPGSGTEITVTTNPYTLAVANEGDSVQFRVRAICSATDTSSYSIYSNASATLLICNDPIAVSSTVLSSGSAEISWTDISGASSFEIEYGPLGFAQGFGMIDIATTNPHIITGLDGSTAYDVYVRAVCDSTSNEYSNWIYGGSFTTPISCPAPYDIVITDVTESTATVAWSDTSGATEWQVEYATPGFVPGTGTFITTTTNPVVVTGLVAGSQYEFYVNALCGPGDVSDVSDVSNTISTLVSVVNLADNQNIQVYAHDNKVYMTFDNVRANTADVKVYNMVGEVIAHDIVETSGTQTLQINDVATGLYVVKLQVDEVSNTIKVFLTNK